MYVEKLYVPKELVLGTCGLKDALCGGLSDFGNKALLIPDMCVSFSRAAP